eukprot:UN21685
MKDLSMYWETFLRRDGKSFLETLWRRMARRGKVQISHFSNI